MSLTSITTQLQQVSIGTNGGCTIITSETTTVTDDATGQIVSTASHIPTYAGKYKALQLFQSTQYQQLFLPAAAAATAAVPNNTTNSAVGATAVMDSNENSIATGQFLADYDEDESIIFERPIKKLRVDHTITTLEDGVDHNENAVVGGTIKPTQLKRKKNKRLEEMMATTAAAAAASKKKKKKSSTKKSKNNKKGTNKPAALTKKKTTTASSSKTTKKSDNDSEYYCEFKMAAPTDWLEYIKRKNQQNEYDKKAQNVNPAGYPSPERIYKFHQIRSRLFNIDETTEVVFEF